jgi:hypothetical protein
VRRLSSHGWASSEKTELVTRKIRKAEGTLCVAGLERDWPGIRVDLIRAALKKLRAAGRVAVALGRRWNRGSNHKRHRNSALSRHRPTRLNRRLNPSSQSSACLVPTTKSRIVQQFTPELPQLEVAGSIPVSRAIRLTCGSRTNRQSRAWQAASYSVRNAMVGSISSARRVGTTQPSMQTPSMTIP